MQAATYLARQPGGDWRAGERHFLRSLIDADLAINDWGWQQAAAVAMEDQPEAEGGPRLPSRS